MALWTPYTQETALDLSKSTAKSGPDLPKNSVQAQLRYGHYSVSPVKQNLPACQPYYADYAYPVSSAPMSPDSVGSTWSDTFRSPKRINTLGPSPPTSPELCDIDSLFDDLEYQAFERDALRAMAEKNGGTLLGNNPRMRRAVQTSQAADDSYRKQRERNNFAAKQSRDRRKLREVRLAFQVTFLKKKMADLQARVAASVCIRCRMCASAE